MHVFISYARADGDSFARRLRDELPRAGFDVWRDIEAIDSLSEWRQQLRQALFSTDVVVVLMTPGAAASKHVTLEWEVAQTLDKPMITARCLSCDIPEELLAKQYRDLSDPTIYSSELLALTRDLRQMQAKPREELRNQLTDLRGNPEFSAFRDAVERLQIWLSSEKYELRIIAAIVRLFEQMKVDARPDRSIRALMDDALAGRYVQPIWLIYELFRDQKAIFDCALRQLGNLFPDLVPADAVKVPIVLAAMIAEDVSGLIDGSAFAEYPDVLHRDFEELLGTVLNGLPDWSSRYGATPQDWCPFFGDRRGTIANVVQAVLQGVVAAKRLIPSFIDVRDLATNRDLLRSLRENGCILIIDSISMRHPIIQRAISQSMLDAYAKTSVVNIAPIQSAFEVLRGMRVVLQIKASDLEFHKRRTDRQEEYGGCREIYDAQELEQWLSDRVRKLFTVIGRTGVPGQAFRFEGRG